MQRVLEEPMTTTPYEDALHAVARLTPDERQSDEQAQRITYNAGGARGRVAVPLVGLNVGAAGRHVRHLLH